MAWPHLMRGTHSPPGGTPAHVRGIAFRISGIFSMSASGTRTVNRS